MSADARRLHVGVEHVSRAFDVLLRSVPSQWHEKIRAQNLTRIGQGFEHSFWGHCCAALDRIAMYAATWGGAGAWNLTDKEICTLASKLALEAHELDSIHLRLNETIEQRIDSVRLLVRIVGVTEPKALTGLGCVKRAQCEKWWRRALRVHVARTVEAGAIQLGLVSLNHGAYASQEAVLRRRAQLERNEECLKRATFKNEAGQVFNLAQLAARSTANPLIRGGELMTRIRGAEEYADGHAHVGLFFTLTAPSKFHRMTQKSNGKAFKNSNYDGVSLPPDAQQWLCKMWARSRADFARQGIKMYGMRVAEPHHDATPHWHMLAWVECEAHAQAVIEIVGAHWLSEHGDEWGAEESRVKIERMIAGGAAGYIAKYIAKSVGHAALAEHLDNVNGKPVKVDLANVPGHVRVDAWASHWGIRQFQAFGMPPVTVWRELRRVTQDQIDKFRTTGEQQVSKAWFACHKFGAIGASWQRFMQAMGGHCMGRGAWLLRMARRPVGQDAVNAYGEPMPLGSGRIVGLATKNKRWLVSRRIAWNATQLHDVTKSDVSNATAGAAGAQSGALPRSWTRFNNCTARITGKLLAELLRPGMGLQQPYNPANDRMVCGI